MTQKPKLSVVVSRRLPEATEERLSELFDVYFNPESTPLTPEALKEAVKGREVLVCTLNDKVDAEVMDAAGPSLKLIANYGSGTDHIDVKGAHERGIIVSNSPANRPDDTADMTIALILTVMRRFKEGSAKLQSDEWQGWSPTDFLGSRLDQKTLCILGMGRVGQAIAKRARAFGMRVAYHNRRRIHADTEASLGVEYVANLDDMLRRADVLSINCPLTPKTFHILDKRRIGLMKPSAVVVNTSRGEVIDEVALTTALKAGRLAGAGLDVFEQGKKFNSELRNLDTVMMLPHMASATHESRTEMGDILVLNVKAYEDGHPAPNRVLPFDV